jgi:hypothetical protein
MEHQIIQINSKIRLKGTLETPNNDPSSYEHRSNTVEVTDWEPNELHVISYEHQKISIRVVLASFYSIFKN